MLTITPEQRNSLLLACDWEDDSGGSMVEAATLAVIRSDLARPGADGAYRLPNVPRDTLVTFLEHELHMVLENAIDRKLLRIWHVCVTLLDRLGHEVDGSIYGEVVCHCSGCENYRRQQDAAFEAMERAKAAGEPPEAVLAAFQMAQ